MTKYGYRYQNELHEIIELMRRAGGSFVRKLADLYNLGDEINQAKLEDAFVNYFTEYDRLLTDHKRSKK